MDKLEQLKGWKRLNDYLENKVEVKTAKLTAKDFASATNLASLCAFCFKFSAKTFFADGVAKIAKP